MADGDQELIRSETGSRRRSPGMGRRQEISARLEGRPGGPPPGSGQDREGAIAPIAAREQDPERQHEEGPGEVQ